MHDAAVRRYRTVEYCWPAACIVLAFSGASLLLRADQVIE